MANREVQLIASKQEFREHMMQNELFGLVVGLSVFSWNLDKRGYKQETNLQPILKEDKMSANGIVAGVEVGFEKKIGSMTNRHLWRPIDLFTYHPGIPGYEPSAVVRAVADEDERKIAGLYATWGQAVRILMQPFAPDELSVSLGTGEIDLTSILHPAKSPIVLPHAV